MTFCLDFYAPSVSKAILVKDLYRHPFASTNTRQAWNSSPMSLNLENSIVFHWRLVVQSRNPFASPHLDYKPLSNSEDIQARSSRVVTLPMLWPPKIHSVRWFLCQVLVNTIRLLYQARIWLVDLWRSEDLNKSDFQNWKSSSFCLFITYSINIDISCPQWILVNFPSCRLSSPEGKLRRWSGRFRFTWLGCLRVGCKSWHGGGRMVG